MVEILQSLDILSSSQLPKSSELTQEIEEWKVENFTIITLPRAVIWFCKSSVGKDSNS